MRRSWAAGGTRKRSGVGLRGGNGQGKYKERYRSHGNSQGNTLACTMNIGKACQEVKAIAGVVVNACGHSTWSQETKDQELKGYRRSKPVWLHETLS